MGGEELYCELVAEAGVVCAVEVGGWEADAEAGVRGVLEGGPAVM